MQISFNGYSFNSVNIVTVRLNEPVKSPIYRYCGPNWYRKNPMIKGFCRFDNYTVEDFQKLEAWRLDLETKEIWSNPSVTIRTVNDRVYEKFYNSMADAKDDYYRIVQHMNQ